MATRYTSNVEEWQAMQDEVIKSLEEILKVIDKSREDIQVEFEKILFDPTNVEMVVLLLRKDHETNIELAENIQELVLYAGKYRRAVERGKRRGVTYPRAYSYYRSWVTRLLNEAGYTNSQELILSFVSRLTKMVQKANIQKTPNEGGSFR